jgi:uncharacterized protein YjeT (DUF2065 family)
MWLPTPIYERTPQLWLLMAVLFVVLGLYIGFDYKLTYFYVAVGFICAVRGLQVLRLRKSYRRMAGEDSDGADDTLIRAAGDY